MFNGWDADVILTEQKVAVLWNGIWHYKEIKKGISLEKIQSRDQRKIKAIKECGYIPYIIKDLGAHSIEVVNEEFSKFLKFIESLNE